MSTLWLTTRDIISLLLVVWAAASVVFVDSDVVKWFICLPVSLGLVGVLSTLFMLAIPNNVMLVANMVTVAIFIVAFEMLKKNQRVCSLEAIKHRTS
jgi:hypothetical protein